VGSLPREPESGGLALAGEIVPRGGLEQLLPQTAGGFRKNHLTLLGVIDSADRRVPILLQANQPSDIRLIPSRVSGAGLKVPCNIWGFHTLTMHLRNRQGSLSG
jgi:hypothetical protein